MENYNQYKFDKLPNSQIIITEKLLERLSFLVGRTAWIASEHACYFYGKEIKENVVFFDDMNKAEDYESNGENSLDPHAYSTGPGAGELNEELENIISTETSDNFVIADIHTHPSGVYESEDEKYDYMFFSAGDLKTSMTWDEYLKRKNPNITHIAGLLNVDRINGNMSISFIWFDANKKKFFRFEDVAIAKMVNGHYEVQSLERVGDIQLLSKHWGDDDITLSNSEKGRINGIGRM